MPWGALDDHFHNHPKLGDIEPAVYPFAVALHALAISWCSDYLTDGRVPRNQPAKLLGRPCDEALQELVRVELWDRLSDGGYYLHDYLDYNPSRAQVEARIQAQIDGGRKGGKASAESRRQRLQEELEGFSDVPPEGPPEGVPQGRPKGLPQGRCQASCNSPTPTPTHSPTPSSSHTKNLSEGAAAPDASPHSGEALPAVVREEGAHPSTRKLVSLYARERKRAGLSAATRRQKGILAQVVGEKLRGGMEESTGEEAIRRMVRKADGPSRLPAFVDEVEAERKRSASLAPAATLPDGPRTAEEREEARIAAEACFKHVRQLSRRDPGRIGQMPAEARAQ